MTGWATEKRPWIFWGVPLPLIEVPVRPGRSLSTIVEIAARNWRLKAEGYDAVVELDRRLAQHYGRMNE